MKFGNIFSNVEITNTEIKSNNLKNVEIKSNLLFKIVKYMPKVWITVTICILVYYVVCYRIYVYNLKIYKAKDGIIENIIKKVSDEFNIKNVEYVFSNKITSPISIGILTKKIVIPDNNFEYKDYEYILRHEIFHIKNKDLEYKFFLILINSIYWFNPIIYYFTDKAGQIIELNCDYNILNSQNMDYRVEYGKVLLKQIERNRIQKFRLVLNFASDRRSVMERFNNVLNKTKTKKSVLIISILTILIISSVLLAVLLPNINFAHIDENEVNNEIVKNTISDEINNETEENVVKVNAVNKETNNETEENSIKFDEVNNETEENIIKVNAVNKETNNVNSNAVKQEMNNSTTEKLEYAESFITPISKGKYTVTKKFGSFNSGTHTGIDLAAENGTDIQAVDAGKVVFAAYKGSYGFLVIIKHDENLMTYYAHCKENLFVVEGQTVEQGQVIAQVGATGNTTGPQLHFEVRDNGVAKNPANYLNF